MVSILPAMPAPLAEDVPDVSLRDEVTGLLQRLLRLNTVNRPGNETVAAELLRDYLARERRRVRARRRRAPHRANLVARLPGGDGPSLMLTGHTDTVVADPEEWSRDPWSGDLVDGEVWGRGALDMKSHVAAAAVAFASLAREGVEAAGRPAARRSWPTRRSGTTTGCRGSSREHPDLVRSDYAINEGGGDRCVLGGTPLYLCSVAEKMTAPFRIHLRGRSGHASDPYAADNALLKAGAGARGARAASSRRARSSPRSRAFLEVVLGEVPPLELALARARALSTRSRPS